FSVVFVAGVCVVGGQRAVNALAATFYPTQLRSTGVGAGLGIGRVGAIVGPYVARAFLTAGWMPPAILYTAALPAPASSLAMFSMRWVIGPRESTVSKSEVLAH